MTNLFPHIRKAVFIERNVDKKTFDYVFKKKIPFIEIEDSGEITVKINQGLEFIRFTYNYRDFKWYIDITIGKTIQSSKTHIIYLSKIIDYNKPDSKSKD